MSINIAEKIIEKLEGSSSARPVLNYVQAGNGPVALDAKDIVSSLNCAASRVEKAGIRKGDIAFMIPGHEPETILLFLALIRAGIIPCILPYLRSGSTSSYIEDIRELANDIDARWLVSASPAAKPSYFRGEGIPEYRHFAGQLSGNSPTPDELSHTASNGQIAYLQLTSGTTGRSKAITVTHEALHNQLTITSKLIGATSADIFVGWLPLNHDMGLISQIFMPLWTGAASVLIAPNHWISDPSSLLKAIDRYRGTISYMPNFGLYYINKRVTTEEVRTLDLSSWRLIVNGAEMIRPGTVAAFNELVKHGRLERNIVAPGYGLGENVLAVSIDLPREAPRILWLSSAALESTGEVVPCSEDDPDAISVVSCGPPIDGTEVRISHDGSISQRARVSGEVVISGNSLCPRYLGKMDEPIRSETGFATGDIGFLDEGELFICGRKKELAIVAGRNINPTIVSSLAEKCLGDLQRRAAAFSVYSEGHGTETLIVICEITRKLSPSEADGFATAIRGAVSDSLQVTVSDIVFKTNNWLPRTTSGKINIGEARKKYLKENHLKRADILREAAVSGVTKQETIESEISQIVGRIARTASVNSQRNLFEQGLDSLGAAELLTEIEVLYGTRISEEFFANPTVRYLLEQLERAAGTSTSSAGTAESPPFLPIPHHARGENPRFTHMMRYGPRGLGSRMSYGQGIRIQKSLLRLPQVSAMFAQDMVDMERWHEILDSTLDLEMCRQQSLFANTWMDWRIRRLSEGRDFSQWVKFNLPKYFYEKIDRNRGVVVVVPHVSKLHWPLYRYLWLNISRNISVVRYQRNDIRQKSETDFDDLNWRAMQAWDASNVLKKGGVLLIAGDGGSGNLGIEVPFAGGSVAFQGGAAELALRTNSYFLPVFPTIENDGSISFDFREFIWSNASDQKSQITEIVHSYADLYQRFFKDMFQQFKWENLTNLRARLR